MGRVAVVSLFFYVLFTRDCAFYYKVQEIAQALSRLIRCDSVPWKLCNGSKWRFSHFRNRTSYMTRISCQLSRLRVPGTSGNLKVTCWWHHKTAQRLRVGTSKVSARLERFMCHKRWGYRVMFWHVFMFSRRAQHQTRRLRLGGLRVFVGCVHCLDCPLWIGFVHSSTAAIFVRSERFGWEKSWD